MATNQELKALITLAGKIDPSLQKAVLEAQKKTQGFNKSLGGLGITSEKTMALIKSGTKAAAVGLTTLAAAGAAALAGMAKVGYSNAISLQQSQKLVASVFGDSASQIEAWSETVLRSYGLSQKAAMEQSASIGGILANYKVADDQAAVMARNLAMRSADMASYFGESTESMFAALESAMTGEAGALKKMGIDMSTVKLEQYALSQGIKKGVANMTEAELAALRYNYILEKTADTQGTFAASTDDAATQQQLLKANFQDITTGIMTRALPAITKITGKLSEMMSRADTSKIGKFVSQISDLALSMAPVAEHLLPLMLSAVTTLMPPLLKLVNVIVPPLTRFFEGTIELITWLLKYVASPIVDVLADVLSWGSSDAWQAADLPMFARGGFASRPSIFGEAGLEAAIPIKPGNPRSLSLLQKTAELLGAKNFGREQSPLLDAFSGLALGGGGVHIHYAPVINGGNKDEIAPVLRQHSIDLEAMLERHENNRRRVSFG